jgi:glycosyltransferase involved in cell wall biosynthesis
MARADQADIDVVMPAYNAAAYILDALASIVGQTCLPKRILVIDDGSSDNTVAIVRQYAEQVRDACEIVCLSQVNAGPSAARNVGLAMCKAQFVAMLDADDIWEPTKLAKQLDCFVTSAWSNLGLVYCDYSLMDRRGVPLVNLGFQLNRDIRGNVARKLRRANQIAGSASAVLLRRQALLDVGLFDETLVCAEDWDLWLRIADKYAVDFIDEPLVRLRQHPHNSQNNESRMLGGEIRFAQKQFLAGRLPLLNIMQLTYRIAQARKNGLTVAQHGECHWLLRMFWSRPSAWIQFEGLRIGRGVLRRLRKLRAK